MEDKFLNDLPGAKLPSVQYDGHRTCLPGTWVQLVDDILGHIHDLQPDSPHILWLSGPAGTGKSSVANSIALHMDSLGRLAASFRFNHNEAAQTPDISIGCLCHQISHFDPMLKSAVLAALQRHGPNISCHAQTKKLLVDLISDKVEIVGSIVIVIDALDESSSDDVPVNGITHEDLMHIVTEDLAHLPCFVKIIITSWEEGSLVTLMSQCGLCKHLQIIDALNVEEDIMQYIHDRLNKIHHSQGRPHDWLTEKQIQELACYCDSLFICATVALQFIEGQPGTNPNVQLKTLLDSSCRLGSQAEAKLDALYKTVLEQSLKGLQADRSDSEHCDEISNWQRVLGAIVSLRTPLTIAAMDVLLGLPTNSLETTWDIISSLLPVLKMDGEMKNEAQLLHKSVFDFLMTQATRDIYIDTALHNRMLAFNCLTCMNSVLKYDMKWILPLQLPSLSAAANIKTGDVTAITYTCGHFIAHLASLMKDDPNPMDEPYICELNAFLTKHLLHWFEVMALLNDMSGAEQVLKLIAECLRVSCL